MTTDAYKTVGFLIGGANAESEYMVAKSSKKQHVEEQSLKQVFWSGFFWPIKTLWHAVVWLSHQFPLKHIGHSLKWFFLLPPVRFIGKIIGFTYIRASWKELRGVTWPSFRDSRRLTTAVIIFSVIFGLLIAVVDYGLDKLFKEVLLK
ncbi:MAG: preprotein translocase subunit SecE [Candidatus Saccharimonadales bacterium]|nr:preprotein translocase subunit SecE [Candidatus Saccharibacteria bacterium]